MENYAVLSLETHLFFARIMKEHGLFLEAGFPCANRDWIQKADWFRRQFENLLRETVQLSGGRINQKTLNSEEIVTEFTLPAERRTESLTGVAIDSRITQQQMGLKAECEDKVSGEVQSAVSRLNQRAIQLLDGFIDFKQNILEEAGKGRLYNANYPLLVEHIQREAKLYQATLQELMSDKEPSYKNIKETVDI